MFSELSAKTDRLHPRLASPRAYNTLKEQVLQRIVNRWLTVGSCSRNPAIFATTGLVADGFIRWDGANNVFVVLHRCN